MKYICEDSDHAQLKRDAEREGFRRAEQLVIAILCGERNIRYALEDAPKPYEMRPQNTCSVREWNPDSPWVKLIDRLDKKEIGE